VTISATSAWVGFWPRARSRSPRTSRGTEPVPRLSKSAKASLYSALSLYYSVRSGSEDLWGNTICLGENEEGETFCLRIFIGIFIMNFDPLADVAPPRHAIESDDEDEDEGIFQTPSSDSKRNVDVEITFKAEKDGQDLESHMPLIVASGQAGHVLARLLSRSPICSRVYANSIEVFLFLFFSTYRLQPPKIGYFVQLPISSQKSKFTVLISESESSQGILPLGYMHPYAQKVINKLEPSR